MLEKVKFIKNILILPKSIIFIFLITAVIVISSALIELNQSKKEMLELMEKQSSSLLETLLASSSNTLLSNEKIEEELKNRLLNNATFVKLLLQRGEINNSILNEIALKNNIFRINIFNNQGKKLYSNYPLEQHINIQEKGNPQTYLKPIFDEEADTLLLGVKKARFLDGMRFAVAVSTPGRGAIVVNVDADQLLKFRQQLGFGVFLKEIAKSNNILYALLQDNNTIIAAAGKEDSFEFLDSAKLSSFNAAGSSFVIIERGESSIFEARHPFLYKNEVIGVFRLGLSMEPVDNINSRITRRIIIISVLLFLFGSIAFAFLFVRQNFLLLSKKYSSFREYSRNIIDNIEEAIVLLGPDRIIKSANKATASILEIDISELNGKNFISVFENRFCTQFLNNPSGVIEIICSINGRNKTLLISKSRYADETGEENIILVIKDLTEIKELEKQQERSERLAAMGELASAVAHEIRNPLNSISTIVQQLNKDFEPEENKEEYKSFTSLVYSEVKRINAIIENFLRFARPVETKPARINVETLIERLNKQYSSIALEKNISFNASSGWNGEVVWDENQIIQAFINIIENAFDATSAGGFVAIKLAEIDEQHLSISFSDTGRGIDENSLKKVFNLYYTTKLKGSGIGLSIVQKIITAHKGSINIKSIAGTGTTITVTLPKTIEDKNETV